MWEKKETFVSSIFSKICYVGCSINIGGNFIGLSVSICIVRFSLTSPVLPQKSYLFFHVFHAVPNTNYSEEFFLILWYLFLYSISLCFLSSRRFLYCSCPVITFFSFRNTVITFTSHFLLSFFYYLDIV